jgi:methylmalonyl-CoA/ethylmalonyl-CoA epimerase
MSSGAAAPDKAMGNLMPLDSETTSRVRNPSWRDTGATTLDHIAVAVEDLEEGIRWYRDNLGFAEIERRTTRGEHTEMISAVMVKGSVCIVLIQGTTPASQVSRFIEEFGPGVQHIALAVDDIDAALENMKTAGGTADIPVIEGEGIRQVFLRRDPGSGVRVELIERNGGNFGDDTVQQLFRAFEERDLV